MKRLTQIDTGLWCLESHFVRLGFRASLRMSVIETGDGLMLYSPVALTSEHLTAISAVGAVAIIMAPNLYHHMYLRPAIALFPNARILVPEGLEAKIGDIASAEPMVNDHSVMLPTGIEHFTFAKHHIRETILFHRASRTLVTSDLLYNYQHEHHKGEKAYFGLIGCYGSPKVAFYHRFSVTDRRISIKAMVDKVSEWNPHRIVMSHGRIVEDANSGQIFAEAWQRFL